MNNIYTQSELINEDFNNHDMYILDGLLKVGLYIFAGSSKVGKSIIATSLAYAVASGNDYLGMTTLKSKVIYFDNDNYPSQTKQRLLALEYGKCDNLIYNFSDASSFYSISGFLDSLYDELKTEINLIIIDCLANLNDISDTDTFKENYRFLKKLSDYAMENNFCVIMIHHTRKGHELEQDSLLGSRALTGATTGTITIEVSNDFATTGTLCFNLRNIKRKINIKKDEKGINWILDDSTEVINEEIDPNVLSIIHTLAKSSSKTIEDSCQELSAKFNYTENPKGLYRFLTRNKDVLNQNCVTFSKNRNGQTRSISLTLKDYEDDTYDSFTGTHDGISKKCQSVTRKGGLTK